MIYELVKRDPAWKAAPVLAAVVAGCGAVFGLENALWILPLVYFLAMNAVWPHQRAVPFQAALPIAGRTLFLARTISLLFMVWVQLAAGSAASLLVRGLATPAQAAGALAFGLYFSFVVLWVLTARVEQCGGWSWWAFTLWFVALLVPPVVLAGLPWAAGIATMGAAGAAARFAWAWRHIPLGFQAAPYQAIVEKPERKRWGRSFALRPLLGSMFSWPYVLFGGLGLFLYLLEGQPLCLAAILLPAYSVTRRRLRWVAGCGLPFTSRRQMAMKIAPYVAVIVIVGVPAAWFQQAADARRVPEISSAAYVEKDVEIVTVPQAPGDSTTLNVTMPFEYWRMALGRAPEIRSPWGETAHPTEFRLAGLGVYNPYTVEGHNTKAFLAWQFGRATKVAYGQTLSPSECSGLTPIPARAPAQLLTFCLLIGFTFLAAWTLEMADARPFNRMRRMAFEGILQIALTWPSIAVDVYGITKGLGSLTEILFKAMLVQVCGNLPAAGIVVAGLASAATPCWLYVRRSTKAEVVGPIRQDNGWDY